MSDPWYIIFILDNLISHIIYISPNYPHLPPPTHSLTHSLTHLPPHTHSLTHSLTHLPPLTHSPTYPKPHAMQCWGFVNNILNATEIPASSWDQVAVGTLSVSTSTHIVNYSYCERRRTHRHWPNHAFTLIKAKANPVLPWPDPSISHPWLYPNPTPCVTLSKTYASVSYTISILS